MSQVRATIYTRRCNLALMESKHQIKSMNAAPYMKNQLQTGVAQLAAKYQQQPMSELLLGLTGLLDTNVENKLTG